MSSAGITSFQDARRHVERIASRTAEEDAAVAFWRVCKRITLLCVLAGSLLIYYFLSVTEEILELPTLQVSVTPAKAGKPSGG